MDQELDEMEAKFMGQGTPGATKRIMMDLKKFKISEELKSYEVSFPITDNFYKWWVSLDIMKFDLAQDLRSDF